MKNTFCFYRNQFNLNLNNIVFCRLNPDTQPDNSSNVIGIRRVDRMLKKPVLVIYLQNTLKQGTIAELEIDFNGQIWESAEGLFKGTYYNNNEKKYKI
jgi:hypothetical protein